MISLISIVVKVGKLGLQVLNLLRSMLASLMPLRFKLLHLTLNQIVLLLEFTVLAAKRVF